MVKYRVSIQYIVVISELAVAIETNQNEQVNIIRWFVSQPDMLLQKTNQHLTTNQDREHK